MQVSGWLAGQEPKLSFHNMDMWYLRGSYREPLSFRSLIGIQILFCHQLRCYGRWRSSCSLIGIGSNVDTVMQNCSMSFLKPEP